jgi:hypothetical protein
MAIWLDFVYKDAEGRGVYGEETERKEDALPEAIISGAWGGGAFRSESAGPDLRGIEAADSEWTD